MSEPIPTPSPEIWTFGGSRVGTGGKRIHCWLDPTGDELYFRSVGSGYAVGSHYEVMISRDGDRITRHGTPTYTGKRADENIREGLNAKHRAAEVALTLAARERADKRDDALELAIDHLCSMARNVPHSQRVGFATYVLSRLLRS